MIEDIDRELSIVSDQVLPSERREGPPDSSVTPRGRESRSLLRRKSGVLGNQLQKSAVYEPQSTFVDVTPPNEHTDKTKTQEKRKTSQKKKNKRREEKEERPNKPHRNRLRGTEETGTHGLARSKKYRGKNLLSVPRNE